MSDTRPVAQKPVDQELDRQKAYWEADKSSRRSPGHPAVRALFEPRADYLASLTGDPENSSVVDVGCGNGFLTRWLEDRFGRTVGVDYSQAMLDASPCREKVCASATDFPFAEGEFDVAVESHLLHHLIPEERLRAVRELNRVSTRAFVLYEPNRNNPLMFAFGAIKREERMSLAFSAGYIRRLLREAGFARHSVRVEGLIVPNKAPAFWAPGARSLDNTFLHHLGFYTRAVVIKNSPA